MNAISVSELRSSLDERLAPGSVSLRFRQAQRLPALRLVAALVLCGSAPAALALRPYDSTDAAVAAPGEFELELGPLGRLREGDRKFRVSPAVVGNYGFAEDRELVLEGERQVAIDGEPGQPRSSIVENGVFVKQVLRHGVLQEQSGLSVATEYGVLLPSIRGEHGTGFSVAGIVSQRTEALSLHLNGAFAINREHEPDVFLGAILEGPYSWPVRPVAEVFGEQASGSPRLISRLIGAIWRPRDNLSFDIGIRAAHAGSESIRELRLGLTWSIALKEGAVK
jgi:hypothetical protein